MVLFFLTVPLPLPLPLPLAPLTELVRVIRLLDSEGWDCAAGDLGRAAEATDDDDLDVAATSGGVFRTSSSWVRACTYFSIALWSNGTDVVVSVVGSVTAG